MNKQPGSTLSTSINGSRSCYITTNRFAFLCVETILARTIHISNKFLNWSWPLFKNVNTLTKRREKGVCLFIKRNIAHLTHRRALRTLIIASAERLKSFFVQAKFTQTLCIRTIHISNEYNSVIIIPKIGSECATPCDCSQKCHACKQQNIDSCRGVWFRGNPGWQLLWEWIDHRNVQTFWWRKRKSCSFQTGTIFKFVYSNAQLHPSSFAFVYPISNLGFGNGICDTLLAWSKALRNSPKLSSRDSIFFWKCWLLPWE